MSGNGAQGRVGWLEQSTAKPFWEPGSLLNVYLQTQMWMGGEDYALRLIFPLSWVSVIPGLCGGGWQRG